MRVQSHALQDAGNRAPRGSLLTTRSAAATASCDIVTIRRAIQAGELRALRLGRHGDYRIPTDALDEWLRPTRTEEN